MKILANDRCLKIKKEKNNNFNPIVHLSGLRRVVRGTETSESDR
jgi:hypothetical protein